MDSITSVYSASCNNGLLIVTIIIDNDEESSIAAGTATTFLTLITNSTAAIVQFHSVTSRIAFTTPAFEPNAPVNIKLELDSEQDSTKLTLANEGIRAIVS